MCINNKIGLQICSKNLILNCRLVHANKCSIIVEWITVILKKNLFAALKYFKNISLAGLFCRIFPKIGREFSFASSASSRVKRHVAYEFPCARTTYTNILQTCRYEPRFTVCHHTARANWWTHRFISPVLSTFCIKGRVSAYEVSDREQSPNEIAIFKAAACQLEDLSLFMKIWKLHF